MKSFGYAEIGSQVLRRDDNALFVVVLKLFDRLYVQRTLCVRHFATWLRPLSDGRFCGVEYAEIKIGDKLVCTVHQGPRFVVIAKDDTMGGEIIVAEGIVAKDPACWDLAIPQ